MTAEGAKYSFVFEYVIPVVNMDLEYEKAVPEGALSVDVSFVIGLKRNRKSLTL